MKEWQVLYWIEQNDGSRQLWWHQGAGVRVLVKTEANRRVAAER